MRATAPRLLTAAWGVLAAAMEMCVTDASAAPAGYVSAYTMIAGQRCGGKPRRAILDEHQPVRYRCRVMRHFDVETVYNGTSVSLTIAGRSGGPVRLGAGYAAEDRMEWRGKRGPGRFMPETAIVRLQSKNPSGQIGSVMAILRVDSGRICKAGYLDGNTGDANEQARAAADRLAGTFRCGVNTAAVIGQDTEFLREIVGRSN